MASHDPVIEMTSTEWRAHVEAWARAGAIQHELWVRLANARISDEDQTALDAQSHLIALTPQEGAERLRTMLAVNPSLRGQESLVDFVRLFGAREDQRSIER